MMPIAVGPQDQRPLSRVQTPERADQRTIRPDPMLDFLARQWPSGTD
jgi:hypothetical protein